MAEAADEATPPGQPPVILCSRPLPPSPPEDYRHPSYDPALQGEPSAGRRGSRDLESLEGGSTQSLQRPQSLKRAVSSSAAPGGGAEGSHSVFCAVHYHFHGSTQVDISGDAGDRSSWSLLEGATALVPPHIRQAWQGDCTKEAYTVGDDPGCAGYRARACVCGRGRVG